MTHRTLITQMLDCIATLRHSSDSFAGDKKAAEAMQAAREYLAAPEQSELVHQVYFDGSWHDKPAEDMWMYTEERGLQPSDIRVLYIAPQPKTELVNQALLDVLKSVIEWMDAPEDSAFSDSQLAEARAAIAAAEQAPQPVELTTYSTCNETLRSQGKPHPRTCAKCGLDQCVAAQGAKT